MPSTLTLFYSQWNKYLALTRLGVREPNSLIVRFLFKAASQEQGSSRSELAMGDVLHGREAECNHLSASFSDGSEDTPVPGAEVSIS